ncbi:hypothetical protein pb186bvf_009667 [Paramecium bursaria]
MYQQFYQGNQIQQVNPLQPLFELHGVMSKVAYGFDLDQAEQHINLNFIEEKIKYNRELFERTCLTKLGQTRSQSAPSNADQKVFLLACEQINHLHEQLNILRAQNQTIMVQLLKALQNLELYARSKQALSRNNQRELTMMQDIDEIKFKINTIADQVLQFNKQLEYTQKPDRQNQFGTQDPEAIRALGDILCEFKKYRIVLCKCLNVVEQLAKKQTNLNVPQRKK